LGYILNDIILGAKARDSVGTETLKQQGGGDREKTGFPRSSQRESSQLGDER
jgi:hypothetical protein